MPESFAHHGSKLRSQDEIQRAHDLIVSFLSGEIPNVFIGDDEKRLMTVAADVLCWCIQHDNPSFQNNLDGLEDAIRVVGGEFKRVM